MIRILTDYSADLPKEIFEKYDIGLVSMIVNIDDKEYRDNVDIFSKDLFDKMRAGAVPKTSQVPYTAFYDFFKECAETNTPCIYLGFSSQLSGTFQVSTLALNEIKEEYPEADITLVDTLCASGGLGLVVLKAAEMAKEGKTKEEIINVIDSYKDQVEHIFTVDNLEYLARGGRLTKSSAYVGNVLSIKPILDVEDGKLVPIGKVRGRKKCLRQVVDLIGERGTDLENQTVIITHGDDLETANHVKDLITEKYGVNEFIINEVGSAIGAHTGPGLIAVFFLK